MAPHVSRFAARVFPRLLVLLTLLTATLAATARPAFAQGVAVGDVHSAVVDGAGTVWTVGANPQGLRDGWAVRWNLRRVWR